MPPPKKKNYKSVKPRNDLRTQFPIEFSPLNPFERQGPPPPSANHLHHHALSSSMAIDGKVWLDEWRVVRWSVGEPRDERHRVSVVVMVQLLAFNVVAMKCLWFLDACF